jgi:hypothetical protein
MIPPIAPRGKPLGLVRRICSQQIPDSPAARPSTKKMIVAAGLCVPKTLSGLVERRIG